MATITVTNSLALGGGRLVASITPLDLEAPEVVLPRAPDAIREVITPQWKHRGAAGARIQRADWTGNAARVWSFTQTWGVEDWATLPAPGAEPVVNADRLLELERVIQRLRGWALDPASTTQEPTRVLFTLGDHSIVAVFKLDVAKLSMDGAGNALVADVSFQFQETV